MLSWKTGREIKKFSGIEVIRVINVCSFKAKVRFIYRLIDLSRVLNFFQHFSFFYYYFNPLHSRLCLRGLPIKQQKSLESNHYIIHTYLLIIIKLFVEDEEIKSNRACLGKRWLSKSGRTSDNLRVAATNVSLGTVSMGCHDHGQPFRNPQVCKRVLIGLRKFIHLTLPTDYLVFFHRISRSHLFFPRRRSRDSVSSAKSHRLIPRQDNPRLRSNTVRVSREIVYPGRGVEGKQLIRRSWMARSRMFPLGDGITTSKFLFSKIISKNLDYILEMLELLEKIDK